jgi:hypothetical protein
MVISLTFQDRLNVARHGHSCTAACVPAGSDVLLCFAFFALFAAKDFLYDPGLAELPTQSGEDPKIQVIPVY